jgi:CheY-like chemotaxis protein
MPPARRFTILVAEDEHSSLEVLVLLLEAEGYEVVAVEDGEKALAQLRVQPIDLVVSDYMMPRLDGLGLCAAMLDDPALASIPVILMSASAHMPTPPVPPVIARMQKPLRFDRLLARIRDAVAARG